MNRINANIQIKLRILTFLIIFLSSKLILLIKILIIKQFRVLFHLNHEE